MDVFEFAKKMELDGAALYKEQLKKTAMHGLKSILEMLIQQEEKHYSLFEKMQKELDFEITKASFKGIKNIFEEMQNEEIPKEQLDFYKKVLDIEVKSEALYRDMAEKEDNEKIKTQILLIADEEKKHQLIINQIIEHIERPNTWLDNAEVHHLEDY